MWQETVIKDKQMHLEWTKWRNHQTRLHDAGKDDEQTSYEDWLAKAQAEITWKARDKEVEEARQEGFVKGHKVGRKEGIDEGIQRAELFMQRNLPINVELNPKWLAFKNKVSKGE